MKLDIVYTNAPFAKVFGDSQILDAAKNFVERVRTARVEEDEKTKEEICFKVFTNSAMYIDALRYVLLDSSPFTEVSVIVGEVRTTLDTNMQYLTYTEEQLRAVNSLYDVYEHILTKLVMQER